MGFQPLFWPLMPRLVLVALCPDSNFQAAGGCNPLLPLSTPFDEPTEKGLGTAAHQAGKVRTEFSSSPDFVL